MVDPYKVLGVSREATDEEVKKAYYEMVKKYHPDNYMNNPLSDLVQEKMKEINEAYDEIQKQRAEVSRYNYNNGDDDGSSAYTGEYIHIRELINNGNFSDADIMLDSIIQSDRNAEWNFLKGCVLTQRGWYFDAQKYFETACYLDPNNTEYRTALNNIRNSASQYGRGYRTTNYGGNGNTGCSACDICAGLICADCMCECCGGDLIRCC
ncbi:MAG: DnaJ domain-containing protein [Oscillospiraceae bacterium]|nr:DnaJ domain-containing protein [Oscillospiraceae bacterium]